MTTRPPPRKKLIEVALPLVAINRESAREKSIRHGHPSTLHLWWARRPLAACRAVLFSSLVDDPSSDPQFLNPDGTVDEDRAGARRAELFTLIEELVKWENSNNPKVINAARAEIARSVASRKIETGELDAATVVWEAKPSALLGTKHPKGPLPRDNALLTAYEVSLGGGINRTAKADAVNAFLAEHAPPVLDPFCGGGSIPLEAQRLGLRAFGSDLNPVPVLITKALIEIPPKFAGQPPVHPDALAAGPDGGKKTKAKAPKGQAGMSTQTWQGAQGLAADVRAYGQWMRDEAENRIGHLYPKIEVTEAMARDRKDLKEYVGQELTVIAWLWARTVPSPNPAAGGAHVPLVRSFWLSTKEGKKAWVEPIILPGGQSYRFEVRTGTPSKDFDPKSGTVVRTGATCILTGQPMPFEHVRSEAKAGRMGSKLMAIVAEGTRGRVYLSPVTDHENIADLPMPNDIPDTAIPEQALSFRVQLYGMDKHYKLFTNRQLVALTTLSDLVMEARAKALADGGTVPYADAVATYLGMVVSKMTTFHNVLARWRAGEGKSAPAFGRQALPMVWDMAEVNPFAGAGGDFNGVIDGTFRTLNGLPASLPGTVEQADAATTTRQSKAIAVCTDPPYYDNIGYADLSDFCYVWLRRSLSDVFPTLFRTLLTPKTDELIATPFRHGGSYEKAAKFFEHGLSKAFDHVREAEHPDYPFTIFYAFKQSETVEADDDDEGDHDTPSTASTGWETMLEGLLATGFLITGTVPMRTEMGTRMVGMGTNSLATSIVLVCHARSASAPMASRREFVTALKSELPNALRKLQSGNIAPVDLAQAAIGPGMAVYSRYSKVLETNGERMGVRAALALINQMLDEVLAEQEGEYDADTRWAVKWFEQYAFDEGPFGEANVLANAMAVGVNGLVEAGILEARAGRVRLLRREELEKGQPETWDPRTDARLCHWEAAQHLIHRLQSGGEQAAADLLRVLGSGIGEVARDLAYRLYTTCERKKWAQEAIHYNALVVSWPEIQKLAGKTEVIRQTTSTTLFTELGS